MLNKKQSGKNFGSKAKRLLTTKKETAETIIFCLKVITLYPNRFQICAQSVQVCRSNKDLIIIIIEKKTGTKKLRHHSDTMKNCRFNV